MQMVLQFSQLIAGLYVLVDVIFHLNQMTKRTTHIKRVAYLVLAVGAALVVQAAVFALIASLTLSPSAFDTYGALFVIGVALYISVNQRAPR